MRDGPRHTDVDHGGERQGALNGVLFRDAAAIEHLRKVDTLVVDKTGTLTMGRPAFSEALAANGFADNEVLRLAASLDQGSEHPLAATLVTAAVERKLALESATDFTALAGLGVRGSVAGTPLALGNAALMHEIGADIGPLATRADTLREQDRASCTSQWTVRSPAW